MSAPTLAEILAAPARNGLYRLSEAQDLPGAVVVSGTRMTSKQALLTELADKLAFPDYFDRNWDALEECLNDLSWFEGETLVVIEDAGVPEAEAPEAWAVLLDILGDAARAWRDEGRVFSVFLRGGHTAYPKVGR